jgi:diadenosine tetraphosphatase ApaH/serine/threonine PP2A family protein phosphatase
MLLQTSPCSHWVCPSYWQELTRLTACLVDLNASHAGCLTARTARPSLLLMQSEFLRCPICRRWCCCCILRSCLQIRTIDRKQEVPHDGAMCDLLWSDPGMGRQHCITLQL